MTSTFTIDRPPVRRFLWLQRIIAIIALINLLFVFFDLSYIPWRDFYFQKLPNLTQVYDRVKGIEPHRKTKKYLLKVDELEAQVQQNGLQSPEVEETLGKLRLLSDEMIQENPFALANKSGHLEQIKIQMRDRIQKDSAREAFNIFWSPAYLSQAGWQKEINFFNTQSRPLIETNYYRHIGINGKFVDKFWQIDLPFVILFALDFLIRSFIIARRDPKINWLEAMLRHWYDLFLLLPFWRWLRVFPVLIHLEQTQLIDLKPIRAQINRDFVNNFAQEITEVVGVQMIDQMQNAIRRGDVASWVFRSQTRRPYIDVNNTNEVQAIASRLIYLSLHDVLPQVQPDMEVLIHHIINNTLNQSPIYKQLQNVPALGNLPDRLADNLTKDLLNGMNKSFKSALEDPKAAELTNRLVNKFGKVLEGELLKNRNLQEIQSLIVDMLEEIKINYIKDLEKEGVEKVLLESDRLRQIVQQ